MKLKYANQIKLNELSASNYDVIIVASGYETRATSLAQKLEEQNSKRIVIAFEEWQDHEQRIKNDAIFKSLGYLPYPAKEGSCESIITILNDVFQDFLFKQDVSVLIDYSCMTKVWYATIINYFINKDSIIRNLDLTFSYTPSKYSDPQPPMPNKYMGPIPGIYCVSTSNKPTALIIGLGYEMERAQGIVEYLDPKTTYAFYSNPAFDKKFVSVVEKNNAQLLSSLGKENVFKHPIGDLKSTDAQLTSLCLSLKSTHRIILAPLGPKPFALLCLLLSARYPEIDVWRVSAGDSGNKYDRKPANTEPVICRIVFERELIATEEKREVSMTS
ncbi:MAG: hypothetical protein HY064_09750 [Bacteroidetes bacterium]|nr:hypothetical protein [Bacteroidota bacterium]